VGGFGSNNYLRKFLKRELGEGIDVKQPHAAYVSKSNGKLMNRQSAIVRGAVLHRMGLDIVRERVMRANYGIDKAVPFDFGTHPLSRMMVGPDGVLRCCEVMHWYARKVHSRR
jgi:hypothetical protein